MVLSDSHSTPPIARKRKTRWLGVEALPYVNALARAKAEILAQEAAQAASIETPAHNLDPIILTPEQAAPIAAVVARILTEAKARNAQRRED